MRPPEWADEAGGAPEGGNASAQRAQALAALAAAAPDQAGAALAAELFSPHLDMHQRLLLLDTLCSAAQGLSAPPAAVRCLRAL